MDHADLGRREAHVAGRRRRAVVEVRHHVDAELDAARLAPEGHAGERLDVLLGVEHDDAARQDVAVADGARAVRHHDAGVGVVGRGRVSVERLEPSGSLRGARAGLERDDAVAGRVGRVDEVEVVGGRHALGARGPGVGDLERVEQAADVVTELVRERVDASPRDGAGRADDALRAVGRATVGGVTGAPAIVVRVGRRAVRAPRRAVVADVREHEDGDLIARLSRPDLHHPLGGGQLERWGEIRAGSGGVDCDRVVANLGPRIAAAGVVVAMEVTRRVARDVVHVERHVGVGPRVVGERDRAHDVALVGRVRLVRPRQHVNADRNVAVRELGRVVVGRREHHGRSRRAEGNRGRLPGPAGREREE